MSVPTTADPTSVDTIVLIHGLWMTSRSWEHWAKRYSDRGYRVIAENWPGLEGDVEALRRDPSPIARLSVRQIVDHYERIIRDLDRRPIIMGHSFGGAFVQVLLDRGLGAAGVGIASGNVRGVRDLPLSTLRSAWSLLRNPIMRHRAVTLTPKQFHYAFGNTLSREASDAAYERYCVPGSRNVLLEGALCNVNPGTALRVNFQKDDGAPLLFIAGGADHVVPASANRSNVRKYSKSKAITAYREFPGRSHFTLGQDGWEDVADYALNWATHPATELAAA